MTCNQIGLLKEENHSMECKENLYRRLLMCYTHFNWDGLKKCFHTFMYMVPIVQYHLSRNFLCPRQCSSPLDPWMDNAYSILLNLSSDLPYKVLSVKLLNNNRGPIVIIPWWLGHSSDICSHFDYMVVAIVTVSRCRRTFLFNLHFAKEGMILAFSYFNHILWWQEIFQNRFS